MGEILCWGESDRLFGPVTRCDDRPNNSNKGTPGSIISYALRTRYRLKNGASIKREKCKNLNSFYTIVYGPYELEIGKF